MGSNASAMSGCVCLIILNGQCRTSSFVRISIGVRAALAFLVVLGSSTTARAFDKAACVASHASAQRSMKGGRGRESREQLLVCADASCPSLVRDDCEEWLSTLELPQQPVTIEGRDAIPSDRVTCDRVERDSRGTADVTERRPEAPPGNGSLAAAEASKAPVPSAPPVEAQGGRDEPSTGHDLVRVPTAQPRHSGPIAAWVTGALALTSFATAAVLGMRGVLNAQSLRDTCAPNCEGSRVSAVRQDLLIADLGALTGVAFSAVTAWMVWTHREADADAGRRPDAARLAAWITGRSFRLDYVRPF
jgi:hypothetical protein